MRCSDDDEALPSDPPRRYISSYRPAGGGAGGQGELVAERDCGSPEGWGGIDALAEC